MGQAQSQKIVIPSRMEEVTPVVEAVASAVEAMHYPPKFIFAVRVATEEAVSNAVRHGNDGDPGKKVTIEYVINGEEVRVVVCDQGGGFVPDCLPDPTTPENIERPCGRGVLLMKRFMTTVAFNACGNCVTMTKRRNCPLPE